MTVEEVFDLLADAAGVRHPNPERENRGLCPAHMDTHNPGLIFRIADSGKLITHCFSQACTAQDIADSIGVPLGAFFPGGKGRVQAPAEYEEPSLLELLKLLNLGMSHEEREQAIFRCLASAYKHPIDNDTLDVEQPMRSLERITVSNYLWLWMQGLYDTETLNWHEIEDAALAQLRQLNRQMRTNVRSSGSAIPRRG